MSERIITLLEHFYTDKRVSEKEFYLTKNLYSKFARSYMCSMKRLKLSEEYKVFMDIILINDVLTDKTNVFNTNKISSVSLRNYIEKNKIRTPLDSFGISGLKIFETENRYIYNAVSNIELIIDEKKRKRFQFLGSFLGALFGALVSVCVALISK